MKLEIATLGAGCFWCVDAVYREVKGIVKSECAYAGGAASHVTYQEICQGNTGFAEVVQLSFDSTQIQYLQLLEIFMSIHDPTSLNRQGHDVGTQYRSVIFYHDPVQQQQAEQFIAQANQLPEYAGKIVTEISPIHHYVPAEPYHQDYFTQNPGQGYCRAVVGPKVEKFRHTLAEKFGREMRLA